MLIGNRKLLSDHNIAIDKFDAQRRQLESEGKTVMFIAVKNQLTGMIAVADTVKATAKQAIHQLHDMNIQTVMLTGDNEHTAKAVLNKLVSIKSSHMFYLKTKRHMLQIYNENSIKLQWWVMVSMTHQH